MTDEFDVVCLGGGVAAEALAHELRGSGITLAVIERERVGGECPYWGCIPSKTLLRSAELLAECRRARELAASHVEWQTDFTKIAARTLAMARGLDDSRAAGALEATGTALVRGDAHLLDARTVAVGDRQLRAQRALVVATGSTPVVPPIAGLDAVEFWTSREADVPRALPRSLAILGAGSIGLELGQAYARFGCDVTLIEAGPAILGMDEPEVGAALAMHLAADGVTLQLGDPCVSVSRQVDRSDDRAAVTLFLQSGTRILADRLLVATGRRANADAWQAAGLSRTSRGWLAVDPATLEVQPGVFAAGDVTGLGGFTHLAHYHGQVIARRLRGLDARASHVAVPRVTFTDPEVASVGLSESAARARGLDVVVSTTDPGASARAFIHGFSHGVLKLVADRRAGTLVGATVVAPRAGEIIGELVLAIRASTPLAVMADVVHPFPAFNRVLDASLAELAAHLDVPALTTGSGHA